MADRYFAEHPITGSHAELVEAEAQHLSRVMRAKAGDDVIVFDGSGAEFAAKVSGIPKGAVTLEIFERREISREPRIELTVAVALPKGERQKWLVEKLTELGAARLVPLLTERGVAQPVDAALARLRRGVIEASKQCGRNRLMEIAPPREALEYFAEHALDTKFVAEPGSEQLGVLPQEVTQLAVAIGPEGGFTSAELKAASENKWRPVSLGRSILRIETAAIAIAAWSGLS
jgi:16S rRNA (uracil1498-N3)-methyltransferase